MKENQIQEEKEIRLKEMYFKEMMDALESVDIFIQELESRGITVDSELKKKVEMAILPF